MSILIETKPYRAYTNLWSSDGDLRKADELNDELAKLDRTNLHTLGLKILWLQLKYATPGDLSYIIRAMVNIHDLKVDRKDYCTSLRLIRRTPEQTYNKLGYKKIASITRMSMCIDDVRIYDRIIRAKYPTKLAKALRTRLKNLGTEFMSDYELDRHVELTEKI